MKTSTLYRAESISSDMLVDSVENSPIHVSSTREPESPYSMPNDTMGSLNTNTPLTKAASFSSPSPSVCSDDRIAYSQAGIRSLEMTVRPQLSLVTDVGGGYGYSSGVGSVYWDDTKKELR